jgi:hypothetical protein
MKTLSLTRFLSLALAILAGAAAAADYEPGTGLQEFTFGNLNGPDYFNDQEPFTFTVRADQQPRLYVYDLESGTERYEVFNFGASMGLVTPEGGTGQWLLAPGTYSLKFRLRQWWIYSPKPIRGQFEVDILPVPQRLKILPKELGSCLGENAVFRVNAEFGREPFSYQWYFNGTNLLAGETNSQLRLLNLTIEQAGLYSAIVSNGFGAAVSPGATLRVFDACVGMSLYAGLSITGLVGRTYLLEYITNVTKTNWTVLATNEMTQPTWLFIDTNTPFDPKKFFRVRLHPSIPLP